MEMNMSDKVTPEKLKSDLKEYESQHGIPQAKAFKMLRETADLIDKLARENQRMKAAISFAISAIKAGSDEDRYVVANQVKRRADEEE
jgi:hypothetical protein